MRLTPALGLVLTALLFLALYFLVPGYSEWLNELVKP
jgi:hypothetical protein